MKKKNKNQRWKLIADPKLQGMLCARVVVYWVICQLTIFATLFGFSFLDGSIGVVVKPLVIPATIISFIVLPLLLLDMIMFSNRFAGPMLNFRKRFSNIADGGAVEELRFRPGDFFPDLSQNYARIFQQNRKSSSTAVKTAVSISDASKATVLDETIMSDV